MPLDPQARMLLDKIAAANVPPLHEMTVEEARQANAKLFITGIEPEAVGTVEDRTPFQGPPVPVTRYRCGSTRPRAKALFRSSFTYTAGVGWSAVSPHTMRNAGH